MRRRLALLVLVVQDRRVGVERDDVRVRQLALRMSRRAHIGHVNFVFRLAGAERSFRRDVPARGRVRRVAHALQLVVGLDGSRDSAAGAAALPDCSRAKPQSANCSCHSPMNAQRPQAARWRRASRRLADHLDLEVMRPEPVRQRGRLVPVIGRLQENQPRLLAGPIHEPAVDRIFERHPQLEMRIRLERIRMIVEEQHVRTARVNRERVEVARCDRRVGALALNADVIVEQRSELGRGEHGRDLEMSTFRHVNVSSMSPRAHTCTKHWNFQVQNAFQTH